MQDLAVLALLALIPIAVVFVMALLGNLISFDNRLVNALVSAVITSAVIVGIAVFTARQFPLKSAILLALVTGGVAFLADIIVNRITFTGRFVNALAKAAVFGVPLAGLVYYLYPVLLAGLDG
jgi:uncharacterized membrane protein (DUF485 family)